PAGVLEDARQAVRVPAEGEHERPIAPDLAAHRRPALRESRVSRARALRSGRGYVGAGLPAARRLRRRRAALADGSADYLGRGPRALEAARAGECRVRGDAAAWPEADAAPGGPALRDARGYG